MGDLENNLSSHSVTLSRSEEIGCFAGRSHQGAGTVRTSSHLSTLHVPRRTAEELAIIDKELRQAAAEFENYCGATVSWIHTDRPSRHMHVHVVLHQVSRSKKP